MTEDGSDSEGAVRCGLGITGSGETARVAFIVGDVALSLTVEEAESLASDLYRFATEIRDGGKTAEHVDGWEVPAKYGLIHPGEELTRAFAIEAAATEKRLFGEQEPKPEAATAKELLEDPEMGGR